MKKNTNNKTVASVALKGTESEAHWQSFLKENERGRKKRKRRRRNETSYFGMIEKQSCEHVNEIHFKSQ